MISDVYDIDVTVEEHEEYDKDDIDEIENPDFAIFEEHSDEYNTFFPEETF